MHKMKKYIKPNIDLLQVNPCTLLAGSGEGQQLDPDNNGDNVFKSKHHDFDEWDAEELSSANWPKTKSVWD